MLPLNPFLFLTLSALHFLVTIDPREYPDTIQPYKPEITSNKKLSNIQDKPREKRSNKKNHNLKFQIKLIKMSLFIQFYKVSSTNNQKCSCHN